MTAAMLIGPSPLFPENLKSLMLGFFRAAETLHVWGNPFWRILVYSVSGPEVPGMAAYHWGFMGLEA